MELLSDEGCVSVGGGITPMDVWRGLQSITTVGGALYDFTNALGATLRNYYGDDATLEAFRGGNLGA